MAANVLQNIKRVTQATLDGLNAWDLDALVAVRADDFIFQGLPRHLGFEPLNNEAYRGLWENMLTPSFKDFKIEAVSSMYDSEARKSTVYCNVSAQTAAGPRSWELIQMMTFTEDGSKLLRLEEFFDSKSFVEMGAEIEAAAKK